MPRIVVKKNDIQVDQYIVESGSVKIGRTPDNDIVLNDPSVSRSHAEIKIDGAKITVIDLNSSNGTYVNGIKISRIISSKANIGIGVFQLEVGGVEASKASAAPPPDDVEATMMFQPTLSGDAPARPSSGNQHGPGHHSAPSHQGPTQLMPSEDDEKKPGWLGRFFGKR